MGYTFFERHFTLDKNDNGPDHYASSDISEMKNYVKELNRVKPILGSEFKNIQNEEMGMAKRSKKAILAKEIYTLEKKYQLITHTLLGLPKWAYLLMNLIIIWEKV